MRKDLSISALFLNPTSSFLLSTWMEPDKAIVAKDDRGSDWQLMKVSLPPLHQTRRYSASW